MACDPQKLMADAMRLAQLPKGARQAVMISLLAKIAGVSADPTKLVQGAAPVIASSVSPGLRKALMISLLCKIRG